MTNQNNEKSKNGKRLALILIALLLIVAVAFGAYTYSRYVSRQNGTGSATVARWGYEIEMTGSTEANGFSTQYDKDASSNTASAAEDKSDAVIATVSSDGNIIGPGATGYVEFTVSGYAEVTAELVASITDFSQIYVTVNSDGDSFQYFPVKYSFYKGEDAIVENTSLGDVISELASPLESYNVPTNTSITATTYKLVWTWAFDNGNQEQGLVASDLDTILGRMSAGGAVAGQESSYSFEAAGKTWTVEAFCLKEGFTLNAFVQQTQQHTAVGD